MMKNGYTGRLLRVDLTTETVTAEALDESIARGYIGGRGIGAYLAYKEMPASRTFERLFNVREGFSKRDDRLPWRSLNEPMPDGPARGNTVPLERMLTEYYAERGWNDQTGIPDRGTIERLGLADLADALR